jgi:hypothetical protein
MQKSASYPARKCLKRLCGGWWVESEFWLSSSLALAKPNKMSICYSIQFGILIFKTGDDPFIFFLNNSSILVQIRFNTDNDEANLGPRSQLHVPDRFPNSPLSGATIFGPGVCNVTFKDLPQPLRSHAQSFRTLGQLLSGQI